MTSELAESGPEGERPVAARRVVLPAVLALLVELGLAWSVLADPGTLVAGLAVHVLVCLAFGAWVARLAARGRDIRLEAWLVWLTLTLGPLGPPVTLLLAILTSSFTASAKPFEEWYQSLFPEAWETPGERLYNRLLSGREDAIAEGSVNSLTDVLFTGSTRAKQAVVALLARRFRSEFAPALQMALNDQDASIRVQAATAATAIEERFHARRLDLEAVVQASPGDPKGHLALARHLDEYAFAGVLDAERQRAVMADALQAYRQFWERAGRDEDVELAIGRLLLRLERFEEAEAHLAALSERSSDPRSVLWHAECLFRLRRFADLRDRAGDPRLAGLAMHDEFVDVGPVLNLWQIAGLAGLAPLAGGESGP